MSPYDHIAADVSEAPIARIDCGRTKGADPLGPAVIAELIDAFRMVRERADLQAAVVAGIGSRARDADAERATPILPHGWGDLIGAMRSIGAPIIAAIDGEALGAQLAFAVLCDVAVASDRSRFGVDARHPWPAEVTPHLIGAAGERAALELTVLGGELDAFEARRAGLINRVVPAFYLADEVGDVAARLTAPSAGARFEAFRAARSIGYAGRRRSP